MRLDALTQRLANEYGYHAVIGCEIEWYVCDAKCGVNDEVRFAYCERLKHSFDAVFYDAIDVEDGVGQVEMSLPFRRDVEVLIADVAAVKRAACHVAETMGLTADFGAKPFPDDYGSGLHIHVHLEDAHGNRIFDKKNGELNAPFAFSIAGLLESAPDYISIFSPSEADDARFVAGFNAPVNYSWGYNNRSCALRIPDGTSELQGVEAILASKGERQWRIEHRLAGANANIEQVICAVMQGVLLGLEQKETPPAPIYGNADEAQYVAECIKKM